ncbi:GNAT family N-acetyltransferase [Sorangium sp. So ce1335]|uniref:GNAT family N-acetyltransferase n=1 Tax=Sorangium sp. So ce1335 TaxID=3133335 RepID=UPI003F641753
MKDSERKHLLKRLDHHRLCLAEPGIVAREFSPDRSECRILLAPAAPAEIATLIAEEKALADRHRYTLEWKVYGHDGPANLVDSLLAAGFESDDEEQVLVLPLANAGGASMGAGALPPGTDIVRVEDERGLAYVAEISRDIGRRNVDAETRRLAGILRDTPDGMTVHVLRFNGEPVACGRTHYAEGSEFAELAGGRTKCAHRRRGYFSALVRHRLAEALARGRTYALVDALPTSEPIMRRLGFTTLTSTRPYVYEPTGGAP